MQLGIGLGLTFGNGRPFSLANLFANGTYSGFDFTDLDPTKTWGPDALPLAYQTDRPTGSALMAAVTTSGQAAGAILDKSAGLALGAERLTNGSFSADANWTKGAGWAISGGVATATAGGADLTQAGAAPGLNVAGIVTAYAMCQFDVVSRSAGQVCMFLGSSGIGLNHATTGTFRELMGRVGVTPEFDITATTFTGSVDNASVRAIGGNHASQATSASRPSYIVSGALRYLSFDGNDDYLQTTLVPAASMTLAAPVRITNASAIIIGSSEVGNTRCFISLNASGQASGGWGAQAFGVICGGPDIRGVDAVILMRVNASVVEIWLGVAGSLTRVYAGAPSGTTNTTAAFAIGARNNAGAPDVFSNGRIYPGPVAVQRFIDDAELAPLMRQLGANAGLSF